MSVLAKSSGRRSSDARVKDEKIVSFLYLDAVGAASATSALGGPRCMSDNAESSRLVNSPAEIAPSDFLWGADEIGRAIGRNGRQAFHLLNRGEIKSAKNVGGRWVVSRAALLRELGA